jgi:hypothetical protein
MTDQYTVYVVETLAQWSEVYKDFYEKSTTHKSPVIHLIGLDCEYINKSNQPESFAMSNKWIKCANCVNCVNGGGGGYIAVCKVQLACPSMSIIIDLCSLGPNLPDTLIDIFKNDAWIKCGVGTGQDLTHLSQNYGLGQCNGGFDVKNYVQMAGCQTPNLATTYSKLYNKQFEKDKRISMVDWSDPLTVEQIKYAANDAYVSYLIGTWIVTRMVGLLNPVVRDCNNGEGEVKEPAEDKPKMLVLKNSVSNEVNYVGLLQEWTQKNKLSMPTYLETTNDASHKQKFSCVCILNSFKRTGEGNSKKEAKQNAAKQVYENITQ